MSIHAQPIAVPAVPAFLMLNAEIREPEAAPAGHYDPESQSWTGSPTPLGAGTYSSRSNGSKGGYSYTSDD